MKWPTANVLVYRLVVVALAGAVAAVGMALDEPRLVAIGRALRTLSGLN